MSYQRGFTIWSLSFVLGVIAFIMYVGILLFEPYMQFYKVKNALDSLAKQPDFATMSRPEIEEALGKRFDIDMIEGVDLKKELFVEQRGRTKTVRFTYERVVPFAGNLSLLLEFDHRKHAGAAE